MTITFDLRGVVTSDHLRFFFFLHRIHRAAHIHPTRYTCGDFYTNSDMHLKLKRNTAGPLVPTSLQELSEFPNMIEAFHCIQKLYLT